VHVSTAATQHGAYGPRTGHVARARRRHSGLRVDTQPTIRLTASNRAAGYRVNLLLTISLLHLGNRKLTKITIVLTKPRPIRLKGRSFLALSLAPELPFEDWLAGLDDLAARSAGFFLRRPVVLDISGLDIKKAELRTLVDELSQRNVRVMGLEGARHSLLGPDMPPAMNDGRPASDFDAATEDESAEAGESVEAPAVETIAASGPSVQVTGSLVVSEPVRSGQSIFFPEGDVTIIGSVASGAEVVAGGSIHVYGTLRGRALAGTTGNGSARIFCRKLEAEMMAIDGFYLTAEDMEPDLRGRAVQVWLEGHALKTGILA
jgi:septum site-determining protein MinC